MKKCGLFVTILVSAMLSVASAQQGQGSCPSGQGGQGGSQSGQRPTVAQLFEHMDANRDNKLSQTEVRGPLKNDFARLDANGDGYLTQAELQAAGPPQGQGQGAGGSAQR